VVTVKRGAIALMMALVLVGLFAQGGKAHAESSWYDGCITKYYGAGEGSNAEHGNDLSCFGFGTSVTALLAGTVSDARWTSFGEYTVTWHLDNPSAARGSPYAYFTDLSGMAVVVGEHVAEGQTVGYSLGWVEFGLTPNYSYGVSGWDWGLDSMFLIIEARNGTTNTQTATVPTSTPTTEVPTATTIPQERLSPPLVVDGGSIEGGLAATPWKYIPGCHCAEFGGRTIM